MNTNEYYDLLVKQYYESINNNPNNLLSNIGYKEFNKELLFWLKERQQIAKRYVEFLKNNGENITAQSTAEIEKGKYDSIVDSYDTTVITPYYYPDNIENKNKKILRYSFLPTSDIPGLLKFDKKGNLEEILSSPGYISKYIIENPYKRTDIYGFEELCNSNNFDVIIGMYGNIHDSDMNVKLHDLKKFRDKLLVDNIKLEYAVENDYYFAMVSTNNQLREKIKTKIK